MPEAVEDPVYKQSHSYSIGDDSSLLLTGVSVCVDAGGCAMHVPVSGRVGALRVQVRHLLNTVSLFAL